MQSGITAANSIQYFPTIFPRYLPYTKFMCYASQPVTRKVFDYNAYIQGRLRGEYVVIYHTVVAEPEGIPADIQLDIKDVLIPDIQDMSAISNVLTESKTLISIIWTETTPRGVPTGYYCYDNRNPIPPTKIISSNCRGAPQ